MGERGTYPAYDNLSDLCRAGADFVEFCTVLLVVEEKRRVGVKLTLAITCLLASPLRSPSHQAIARNLTHTPSPAPPRT